MKTANAEPHPNRVRNEAVFLYDMNVDDIFQSNGYIVIDSSLGLVDPHAKSLEGGEHSPPSPLSPSSLH